MSAKSIYTAYCAGVGGVAFNGYLLPTWEDFRADPSKKKQADAWEAAAEKAINWERIQAYWRTSGGDWDALEVAIKEALA